jgi:hypothetical protein
MWATGHEASTAAGQHPEQAETAEVTIKMQPLVDNAILGTIFYQL